MPISIGLVTVFSQDVLLRRFCVSTIGASRADWSERSSSVDIKKGDPESPVTSWILRRERSSN